jgi:hypothetical protein
MGNDYEHCIECETIYVNEPCPHRDHHTLRQNKCEYFLDPFINFLASHGLLEEFFRYLDYDPYAYLYEE